MTEMRELRLIEDAKPTLRSSTEGLQASDSLINKHDIGGDKLEIEHRPKSASHVDTVAPNWSQAGTKAKSDLKREYKRLESDYDKLLQDFRFCQRENRDQSLELRDLKKQIVHLQNINRQNEQLQETFRARNQTTDGQKEQVRRERHELAEQFYRQEDTIEHLRHELFKRKNFTESLTIQTREANEQKSNLEVVNRKLARQIKELSENLTECKDDLLRLQPPSQMSDSELSEQYSNLHQQISRWVDDRTEDSQLLEERFEALSSTIENSPGLLQKYIKNDYLRLAAKHPNSQPLILRHVIHSYLDACIFRDDICLFGLDTGTTNFLKGVEQGMTLLEPQRDTVTIRSWRSETLKAIFHMDEFRNEQHKEAVNASQLLYDSLSQLLPGAEENKEGWKELYEQVIVPAVQVSTSIRLSPIDYRVASRMPKPPDQSKTMFINELQKCEMMDIITHKMIRPDSILKIAENGRIGQQMLVVQPALLRASKGHNDNFVLCKPLVLVRLDEPMARRNKGIKVISSWFGGVAED